MDAGVPATLRLALDQLRFRNLPVEHEVAANSGTRPHNDRRARHSQQE